jgi:putative ABC transport system permease protein
MFLIAFNASGVAFEERARENATMMAFGVSRRKILVYSMFEGAILGVVAVVLGVLGGFAFVRFGVMANVETTMPDILLTFVVTPAAVFTVFGLGIGTVAAAPLLNYRRLRRLDIPSTLRVME